MNWEKKVLVKSTLERKKGQYSFFLGRWQPLHAGHQEMFQQVLDAGGNVCIAIRDIQDLDSKNPFSALEVMGNIMEVYEKEIKEERVKVIVVPDIDSVCFGRGVGYDIVEFVPPQEIADISATKIREQMKLEGKL